MPTNHPVPENNTRIGLNYYPDTLHYREADLQTWLPLLKSMGVHWLSLLSPTNRAIPEVFITGLLENGIEPIVHLGQALTPSPNKHEFEVLLSSYAAWGVRYVALFDRPNMQSSWTGENWVQQQLVNRFLDTFLEYAEIVCQLGMCPILSPLEPGGDFWDTAFLRSALQGIKDRGRQRLLSRLVIGAYAWPDNQPLDWGSGGPNAGREHARTSPQKASRISSVSGFSIGTTPFLKQCSIPDYRSFCWGLAAASGHEKRQPAGS